MKQLSNIPLSPVERTDLASVQRHPGVAVLVEKILATHARQQLEAVHDVQADDPDRVTKIDGICSVANGLKLALELLRREMDLNRRIFEQAEVERQEESQNAERKK